MQASPKIYENQVDGNVHGTRVRTKIPLFRHGLDRERSQVSGVFLAADAARVLELGRKRGFRTVRDKGGAWLCTLYITAPQCSPARTLRIRYYLDAPPARLDPQGECVLIESRCANARHVSGMPLVVSHKLKIRSSMATILSRGLPRFGIAPFSLAIDGVVVCRREVLESKEGRLSIDTERSYGSVRLGADGIEILLDAPVPEPKIEYKFARDPVPEIIAAFAACGTDTRANFAILSASKQRPGH